MVKKDKNRNLNFFKSTFIIAVILIVMGLVTPTLLKSLKFGLDLQGGFEVLYQVESLDGSKVTKDMVTNTYKTISKRIDALGVSEPEIVVEGNDRIRVQLAGVTEPAEARKTLSSVASLSFRDSSDNLLMSSDVLRPGSAKVGQDEKGKPAVSLTVSDKDKFYKITKQISETKDKLIVIWLDYNGTASYKNEAGKCGGSNPAGCLSAASVSQGFASDVIIQGNFTTDEVTELVSLINSGSLPTKLVEISSKTVEASFGANSLDLTARAGVIGVISIMAVMILIYRFAGLMASVGILIYTFLTFVSFWLFGGVLTLPGIAALVIGIGMAVDSCVISFARIKDELKHDIRLEGAYKKGNENSFMAILDSNVTTLISALILFTFGESSVKGFATMLIISTIVTMVIMVFLTRNLIGLFVKTGLFDDKLNFFIGFKKSKKVRKPIDFIKLRKPAYIYMAILVIVGIVSLSTNKLTLGIDFKGGSSISIKSETKLNVKDLKSDIKELGYKLYDTEIINDKNITLKVQDSFKEKQVLKTEKYFNEKYKADTTIGVVSNLVKRDLVRNAVFAVILAIIGILLYVAARFRFSYAITAIIALLHDAFVIIVAFSLFKLEVTSIFIAAILSIIGFSVNDTIVSFDRVRETLRNKNDGKAKSEEELADVINEAINLTLTRSIITTLLTLIPVVMLILLGSNEIINFNLAMFFGLIAGVLSTIFIACQLWYEIERHNIGKPAKKKWYEEPDEKPKKKVKNAKIEKDNKKEVTNSKKVVKKKTK
jgi:SecD/SecF fusion protein